MTFIACLLVTRSVYPSDDRRAVGSTTAMQISLRAIARGYERLVPRAVLGARSTAPKDRSSIAGSAGRGAMTFEVIDAVAPVAQDMKAACADYFGDTHENIPQDSFGSG
jgi:hypothetical protein